MRNSSSIDGYYDTLVELLIIESRKSHVSLKHFSKNAIFLASTLQRSYLKTSDAHKAQTTEEGGGEEDDVGED